MTEMTGAGDEACHSDTLTRWRFDQLREHVVVSVKDAVQAAMNGMRTAMSSRAEEAPIDYERENDLERGIRIGRSFGPHFNGDQDSNWKTIALWALGVLQAIGVFVLTIIYSSITDLKQAQSQTHDDVTTIKCQLNPQCRIVVGKP